MESRWWQAVENEDGSYYVNEYRTDEHSNTSRDTIWDEISQQAADRIVDALTEAQKEINAKNHETT